MAHNNLSLRTTRNTDLILIITIWLFCLSADAQHRISIQSGNGKPLPETLYLAGDFNNWNPADSNYLFKNGSLFINLKRDSIAAKITGGSWELAEADADGSARPNRNINLYKSSEISLTFYGFESHTNHPPRGVKLITDSSQMMFEGQFRRVWVYLPHDYSATRNRYPVLYLHDGQNLFKGLQGSNTKWAIARCLDSLQLPLIVIGIEHGGAKRIDELSPFPNAKYGGGKGDAYLSFIDTQLIPYVDSNFRSIPSAGHRYIGGSSLGGLISLWAILEYPQRYKGALLFSPAYWFNPEVMESLVKAQAPDKGQHRVYQMIGDSEGSNAQAAVSNMLRCDSLLQSSFPSWQLHHKVVAGGKHNEELWQNEFAEALIWLLKPAP